MTTEPTLDFIVASLRQVTPHVDPMKATPASETIKSAAQRLADLSDVTRESVSRWLAENPDNADVLGLVVGLGREKLKMALVARFGTGGHTKLSKNHAEDVVTWLDDDYDLLRHLEENRRRSFTFGDLLVARAGSRVTAGRAARSGRALEDVLEDIAKSLDLPYELRTRFVGRNGQSGPCDLVIPSGADADIAVAAKVFDSTGSKQTAAFDEIKAMAEVRQPRQYVMVVLDGIGWKSRASDLRRIYELFATRQIDGIYTLATIERFRHDLTEAARFRGLL